MNDKSKRNEALTVARKPYARPELREFGQVGALTQSGTGDKAERGGMDMGMMGLDKDKP
jgi:hypothetical protein